MQASWWCLAKYNMLSSASIPGGVWVKSNAGLTLFCKQSGDMVVKIFDQTVTSHSY